MEEYNMYEYDDEVLDTFLKTQILRRLQRNF